ncbi:MAG: hypothetical protein IPK58_24725 [Acidobacteria bacterium]|nr:hypothetical protein [Acidobacteriota bacterium]
MKAAKKIEGRAEKSARSSILLRKFQIPEEIPDSRFQIPRIPSRLKKIPSRFQDSKPIPRFKKAVGKSRGSNSAPRGAI